ncbi:hypothetical protein A1QO_02710 [Vibrio genomosp. F10 str. ZF-129]|uniref:Uncharacterized protein n=1 Tax=Vibrio genomosp. F10 str. ZF-129 TaxID=1187848 RepID=A0A1E5BKB3_9VIBR|nr:hypothetical protein [Vibrio genomosp. F10]OEE38309.1 hypothetical protein A1QO_02710 [Vibrio genomosp. F10 str. ZF-129]
MKTLLKAANLKKVVKLIGTNQYFTVSIDTKGKITFCPVGGGFVQSLKSNDDSMFEIVDEMPTEYKKAVLTLDDVPSSIFEGYCIPTQRWNGWAIPVFEVSVAKEIMAMVNGTMPEFYSVTRNDEKGFFEIEEHDHDETSQLEDFIINVDGKDIVVVSFMGANWTWCDYYGDKATEMLAKFVRFDDNE